jgi:hypothetical protein
MSERAREKRRRFMFFLFERLEVRGERQGNAALPPRSETLNYKLI